MSGTQPFDLPALLAAAEAVETLLGPGPTDVVRRAVEQVADQVGVHTPGELRALGIGMLIASQMSDTPLPSALVGGCVLVRSAQGR